MLMLGVLDTTAEMSCGVDTTPRIMHTGLSDNVDAASALDEIFAALLRPCHACAGGGDEMRARVERAGASSRFKDARVGKSRVIRAAGCACMCNLTLGRCVAGSGIIAASCCQYVYACEPPSWLGSQPVASSVELDSVAAAACVPEVEV